MKLKWPWRREGQPDAPGGREGDAPPVVSSAPAPSLAHYPLDDFLARNRALLVGGYILVFAIFVVAVGATGLGIISEFPHAMFGLLRGHRDSWDQFLDLANNVRVPEWSGLAIIGAYVILQGVILWGCGRVRLARGRRQPWRPVAAIVAVAAAAGPLTLGVLGIFVAAALTSYGRFDQSVPNFVRAVARLSYDRTWLVLWAGWVFWLLVALVYWRRRESLRILPRLIRALLAGSWIEFCLALPVDISLRPHAKDCPCATGSWLTLICAAPVLIWTIGPALYLLYLRERELSLAMPGRSTMILLRKSVVATPRPGEARIERSVSAARTLSVVAIVLGLLGVQIGVWREILPGADFDGFGTEQAAWLIALLCPILLIVLRNAVRQVFRSPDAGAAVPWLILDAESWVERAIGALWLLGIALSGWLSSFGVIVTVVDRLVTGSETPNPIGAAFAFLAFLVILILDTWPALGAAGDLIRLREIRRDARRLAAAPAPAAPSESPGQ